MPLYATTDYNRGSVGTSIGGLPTPVDTERYLQALLRAETRPQPAAMPQPGAGSVPVRPVAPPRTVSVLRDPNAGMSALERQARDAQFRDVVLAQKAREQGAPRISRNIGNQQLFTIDPESFNAYQREAYLPQSSSQVTSPDEEARSRVNLLSELAFRQRFGTPQRLAG